MTAEEKETTAGSTPVVKKSKGRSMPMLALAVVVTALVTFGITALIVNMLERKSEQAVPQHNVVELDETTIDPAIWGQNFPIQYESYKRTSEMVPTTYAGSMPVEQEATETDPRTIVSSSRLEEDPRLREMWAGYAFATDYRHARGHEYMLDDQRYTLRTQQFDQPGTCLNCHASMVDVYNELGDGDMNKGFDAVNALSYEEASSYAEHPITCIDCHNPETMELQITRPALINGLRDLKATEGIENYDVNKDATIEEMRSYVCAQCHVEYYFAGEEKTLTFPWAKGIELDQIWEYYQEDGHVDWVHARTGADMTKAQHPEFDIWSNGVHADAGVSCADCHMSYDRAGAQKVTDHHIGSPLLNINQSCGTCHSDDEETMLNRVVTIQDRYVESRNRAFDALVSLIDNIEAAMEDGTPEEYIELAREYQDKASFYLDYTYSENSYGFHAPDYSQEILNTSLDASRLGELALKGVPAEELEPSETSQKYTKAIAERNSDD